jgi:hypothetical protein
MDLVVRISPSTPEDHAGIHYGGIQVSHENLWYTANKLNTASTQHGGRALTALKAAAEEAARSGKALILINDHAGISDRPRHVSLSEEIHHAMQSSLGGGENLGQHLRSQIKRGTDSCEIRTRRWPRQPYPRKLTPTDSPSRTDGGENRRSFNGWQALSRTGVTIRSSAPSRRCIHRNAKERLWKLETKSHRRRNL